MNTLQWILTFFSWQGKQSVHPDHWLRWQSTGAGELTSLLLLLGRGRKSGLRSLKLCFERDWRLEGENYLCVYVFPPGSWFVGNGKHPKMSHPSIHHQNWAGPAGAVPGDFVLGFLLFQDIFAFPIGRLQLNMYMCIDIWPTILSKENVMKGQVLKKS